MMMRKATKSQQLRVRLTSEARMALEEYAKSQNSDATLSDVIREFIQYMVGSERQHPIRVSAEAYGVLVNLSQLWARTQEQTVDQCIFDINDLLNHPQIKTSLLVKEIQLRRAYLRNVNVDGSDHP